MKALDIIDAQDISGMARNARCNLMLAAAQGFASFLRESIANDIATLRDEHHAKGWPVADIRERSEGRGRPPAIAYVWNVDASPVDIARAMRAVVTMARLASAVRFDADASETVETAMRAKLAELFNVDPTMYAVWCDEARQHLSGPEAAIADIDGSAWTSSMKGRDASLRTEGFLGMNRSEHAYAAAPDAYLSERDMRA